MHERGPPQLVNACMQPGPEAAENKFFQEVTVAWAEVYGEGNYVRDAIRWFLHKFNVDLVDTLLAFKASARLMCPATAPLLNPTPA